MRRTLIAIVLLSLVIPAQALWAKKREEPKPEEEKSQLVSSNFSGLSWRNIGPALTSGRIIDMAVNPDDNDTIYLAVASGGVWKTVNHGNTWQPIFDGEGSYSTGCITLDPQNPNAVWVGSGENNSQRSVGYGDGVYRSLDGGKTWKNMGLGDSEHIGKIIVHPHDSQTVYVASQGPLWSAGGDRGLYKTTDGGESWELVLEISEHTGVSDIVMDPRHPDTLIASSYQRRRHVWTMINGGPESGLHKTTDGGKTWRQLKGGLPGGELGRIGLAQSPVNPDFVYAIVEGQPKTQGFFRSTDRGESWEKRSGYVSGSGQYYQEIIADPVDVDRVYSNDTWMQVTDDGGATFRAVPERTKHVDNHALWINPKNNDHLLAGCDGGLYETWDQGENWHYFANLPITQFYRVAVSNDLPFYYVYGGTQDNFTLGGPSRTDNQHGIRNSDWFITVGGDGFQPQIDPENPDIIYSQWQHGNLVRHDRKSGEILDIKPRSSDEPLVWNWDAALAISPHSSTRLYFGANRLFRSDDRGDSWRAVSPDLRREVDRNQLPVMGKVWSIDAIAKNRSTSIYGNIVTLSESPKVEGLLYVGLDDGRVHVSEDGGENWRMVDDFPGVPKHTYVNRLRASQHDSDTAFAAFNNHKNGDFKPYLLRSTDRGQTWSSIAGDLPERGSVYSMEQDHVAEQLLFAGTEFGVFFTVDGGDHWVELSSGMPTIAARDLVIQRRESDLVVASFGRGFYVLDDYSPLRTIDASKMEQEFVNFSVKEALAYHPAVPLGLRGKSFQGDSYYSAANPPFGAIFTYYLKDGLDTLKAQRQQREKEIEEEGGTIEYPSWEELHAEDAEVAPTMVITVRDAAGQVVRRLTGPTSAGMHRVAWDLRYPSPEPVSLTPPDTSNPFVDPSRGPAVVPGEFTVSFATEVRGEVKPMGKPQTFQVTALGTATLPAADKAEVLAFQHKTADLQRAVFGAAGALEEANERLGLIRQAIRQTPNATADMAAEAKRLQAELRQLGLGLFGDHVKQRAVVPTKPGIMQRVGQVVGGHWNTSSSPTGTHRQSYQTAAEQFTEFLGQLRQAVGVDLPKLEQQLEGAGAAWTPGRIPEWRME